MKASLLSERMKLRANTKYNNNDCVCAAGYKRGRL